MRIKSKMKQFREWMKEKYGEDVWKSFMKNKNSSLKRIAKNRLPEKYVLATFYWSNTPESHSYWSRIDNSWQEYCVRKGWHSTNLFKKPCK